MLKNIFKRNAVSAPANTEFKEARDMHSMAFHIVQDDKALCGTDSAMNGSSNVTVTRVLSTVKMQHAGWYWCSDCCSAFTGESKEFFTSARMK